MSHHNYSTVTLEESVTGEVSPERTEVTHWREYHAGFAEGQKAFIDDPGQARAIALGARLIHREGLSFGISEGERAYYLGMLYGVLSAEFIAAGGTR